MEETNPTAPRRPRRSFDSAYKLHVARMVREQGLSIHQVCRDLDLSTSAVRQWVNNLTTTGVSGQSRMAAIRHEAQPASPPTEHRDAR